MIKISSFKLDSGEAPPICVVCKQVIVNELTEISSQAGDFFHPACGLLTEHNNTKHLDDVYAWNEISREYARDKGD